MLKPVFAIRDIKTHFLNPFIDDSVDSAIRGFRFSAYDAQKNMTMVGFAPEDFTLYQIGDFDTISGELVPMEPKFICNCEVHTNEE